LSKLARCARHGCVRTRQDRLHEDRRAEGHVRRTE